MSTGDDKTSAESIRALARLARLELSPEEEEALRSDLEAILGYAGNLPAGLEAASDGDAGHASAAVNSGRLDEPRDSLDRDIVFSQAPGTKDCFFRVPPAVDR